MPSYSWLIYGATGYTGTLIAEEALRRGHEPILAGRTREKLAPLAKKLGLKYMVFDLSDVKTIAEAIADVDIVVNAAGPFMDTSEPLIRACLATHTHYLDITGEIPVFERTFTYHDAAVKNRIALIGGVGFDVVPTDCLAAHVASKVQGAHTLEIAFWGMSKISPGTMKSLIGNSTMGGLVRRDGQLTSYPLGAGGRTIRFSKGDAYAMPIPWGDIATGFRTTRIPNITTYMVMPRGLVLAARLTAPFARLMMRVPPLRRMAANMLGDAMTGPDATLREIATTYIWAKAANRENTVIAESWLETHEPYRFTAESTVYAVERVADYHPVGAVTPALAFGADFVLDIPGTIRKDVL
jgi:short subunit dehydrogenase-like uncharacterized protein